MQLFETHIDQMIMTVAPFVEPMRFDGIALELFLRQFCVCVTLLVNFEC